MRPVLAVAIAMLILGSVAAYSRFRDSVPPPDPMAIQRVSAEGKFSVDVTLTFDAQPDAFQLESSSLLLRLDGADGAAGYRYATEEKLLAGEPISLDVDGLREGDNEFLLGGFLSRRQAYRVALRAVTCIA